MSSPYGSVSEDLYQRSAEGSDWRTSLSRIHADYEQLSQNNSMRRGCARIALPFDEHALEPHLPEVSNCRVRVVARNQDYIGHIIAKILSQPTEQKLVHSVTFWSQWHAIEELQQGWEGPNSSPISKAVLFRTLLLTSKLLSLPDFQEPQLSPLYDGGVQLNWRHGNRTLEGELNESSCIGLIGTDRLSESTVYLETEVDYNSPESFTAYLAWLQNQSVPWPTQ
jgi:hypothetical protein